MSSWLTHTKLLFASILCISLISTLSYANDILSIPDTDVSDVGMVLPARGMSMDEVSNQFGQPLEVIDPVGTPPITRWTYEKFTVHFEYQYVILAVKKRKPNP